MTMECWSNELKPRQDWNHAWGTAPINVITRRLMGIRPLAPGFKKVMIAPSPGDLRSAGIKTPTIHGPVSMNFACKGKEFLMDLAIPAGITADVHIPGGKSGFETGRQIPGSKTVFSELKGGQYSFRAEL